MQTAQLLLLVLMLIAGMFIPVMASLNATLGGKLGSPMFAVCILCLAGVCRCSNPAYCAADVTGPVNTPIPTRVY